MGKFATPSNPLARAAADLPGEIVRLSPSEYRFPDVTVSCDPSDRPVRERMEVQVPRVIVEVLSPSTEKEDRTTKFARYRACPSVQEYMLIGSTYKSIEVHRREGNFWKPFYYQEGDIVELTSLDVTFPFEEAYYRVRI